MVLLPSFFESKANAYDTKGCPVKQLGNHSEWIGGIQRLLGDAKAAHNSLHLLTWTYTRQELVLPIQTVLQLDGKPDVRNIRKRASAFFDDKSRNDTNYGFFCAVHRRVARPEGDRVRSSDRAGD